MAKKIQIKAIEMVRRIRDEQAKILADKSKAEIIAFFRKAGEAARQEVNQRETAKQKPKKTG